ncbi:MAG: beta-ketoacyl synthase N-terminal-like domain-containing protein [Planctomycetota bacterium]|nr:beta-ketoacyl synthase N-terminal-like domain-containing protein [Planctomycetota bacterium]
MSRSVVITGLGPITAFGVGMDPLWEALVEGKSAIAPLARFDASGFDCSFGAELSNEAYSVKKIVPKSYRKAVKVMCRDIELALGAALEAVSNANLVTKGTDPDVEPTIAPGRFGCHIGAGLIAADVDELTMALVSSKAEEGGVDLNQWGDKGMQTLTPLWLLKYLPNMLACHVTIVHDCRGPSNTITCCETSGALSLGESMRVIERDDADACLTGGTEFKLNPMAMYRQQCAQRLAMTNGDEDPTSVVRPYDAHAKGTVLGEGGGLLILEAEDHAKSRGATIFAKLSGYAASQSFCEDTVGIGITDNGVGIADAIHAALTQSNISPDAISAIVPFGSSIPSVDQAEVSALHSIFGDRASSIPIVTTIPNVGNCNAGNGGISLCVGAKCIAQQKLPARLNTQGVEMLDANACDARDADLNHILVLSASQGGQNTAVILSRMDS